MEASTEAPVRPTDIPLLGIRHAFDDAGARLAGLGAISFVGIVVLENVIR